MRAQFRLGGGISPSTVARVPPTAPIRISVIIALIIKSVSKLSLSVLQERDLERHVRHMTSSPVVALCLQRENAVGRLLEVLGPSDPRVAKKQSQFFLRGSFGEDSIQNAFYGKFGPIRFLFDSLLVKSIFCCVITSLAY